jgi:GT2 family glycosyltransferase
LSNARNSGARAAKYDVIAFVDDDVFVRTGWLNAIGGAFAAFPQIACVGGNTIPVFESGRPSWVDDGLLPFFGATCLGEARREMRYPEHPFGVNMAIRRAVLDAIGGFNPGLGRTRSGLRSNEESDLFRRASAAGFRTLYEPAAVIEHRVPAGRAQQRWVLSRSYWQGVSDVLMHCVDVGSYSRRQLLREGFGELLGLLRETHGGHVSPRRILWHLHGLPFEAKVHRAYRAGKARQLIAGGFGL